MTSPRHRHTNSIQTGSCPQPATQTSEVHGKDTHAIQTVGSRDRGTLHTLLH